MFCIGIWTLLEMLVGCHSTNHPFSLNLLTALSHTTIAEKFLPQICNCGSKVDIFRSLKFHPEKGQIVVLLSEFHGRHTIKSRN